MAVGLGQTALLVLGVGVLFGRDIYSALPSSVTAAFDSGAFNQVSGMLAQRFPGVEVVPSSYPIAPAKALASNVLTVVMLGLLALVFAGDKIFPALGMAVPAYTNNVANNKFAACMGIWFLGNMIISNLQKSNAFEIYFDGSLVFSKLEHGRMPMVQEIMLPIEVAMKKAMEGMGAGATGGGFAVPDGMLDEAPLL